MSVELRIHPRTATPAAAADAAFDQLEPRADPQRREAEPFSTVARWSQSVLAHVAAHPELLVGKLAAEKFAAILDAYTLLAWSDGTLRSSIRDVVRQSGHHRSAVIRAMRVLDAAGAWRRTFRGRSKNWHEHQVALAAGVRVSNWCSQHVLIDLISAVENPSTDTPSGGRHLSTSSLDTKMVKNTSTANGGGAPRQVGAAPRPHRQKRVFSSETNALYARLRAESSLFGRSSPARIKASLTRFSRAGWQALDVLLAVGQVQQTMGWTTPPDRVKNPDAWLLALLGQLHADQVDSDRHLDPQVRDDRWIARTIHAETARCAHGKAGGELLMPSGRRYCWTCDDIDSD